jgi:hypothetical protein
MQSIGIIHVPWILRACGRNPLVRASDRLELLIIALGILVGLVAAACAGALGTAVHEERSRVYIAQAQSRHTVTAKAIDDSTIVFGADDNTATRVSARWQVNRIEHAGSFTWDRVVKTGDALRIWVDSDGNRVDPPTPTSQAGVDAVCLAFSVWQTVVLVVTGLICWGRSRLQRRRDAAWEREIRWLIHDSAGGNPNS